MVMSKVSKAWRASALDACCPDIVLLSGIRGQVGRGLVERAGVGVLAARAARPAVVATGVVRGALVPAALVPAAALVAAAGALVAPVRLAAARATDIAGRRSAVVTPEDGRRIAPVPGAPVVRGP